jgi:uncharacterized protein YndB with AHSA1/START domain
MQTIDGTLEQVDSRWRLRFRRRLAHPPEKVWRAIVEPEQRDRWFPQQIVGDWRIGSRLRFVSEFGDFEGEVLAFEPPSLIEFRWGTDTIRVEVAPDGEGSLLTLLDMFDELGKAARDAAGWHVCLDALESALDGGKGSADWQTAHARYVEAFGSEASTIGPPESATRNR